LISPSSYKIRNLPKNPVDYENKKYSCFIDNNVFVTNGCQQILYQPVGSGGWLKGDISEKIETTT
jgi:hypothetical protein